ncbi:AI-2E family transporter [Clostridium polyendosporum]|uniref:AI-2E family transporter n=1 Tax=Clostridium polyendosporum TaxID=69208 RepID=A0A919RWT5_9CLOT|nr:AI-2E family transporter [Clostridium polyendosporum]GIM27920.1 AI-2E family transporter [Clostridium polyendosporum]
MKKFSRKLVVNIIIVGLLVLCIILYIKLKIIREVISILLFSFILSYSLKPLYKIIVIKARVNKRITAALLILGLVGLFIAAFVFLIPSLFKESSNIEQIINSGENFVDWISNKIKINNYKIFNTINEQITEKINVIFVELSEKTFDWIIDLSENILSLAVVPVVTYYFLADGELIGNKILILLPMNKRSLIKKISKDIDKILGKYIFSQFILCLIIGILSFVVLVGLRVQFPLWLSIFNAVVNIIPYFGPIFGALPAILVALMQSPSKAIWTTLLFLIIQQVEGNIIAPRITASSISIHPLVIIVLLLIGEKVGGFMGMILAIPIGVITKVIYENINHHLF